MLTLTVRRLPFLPLLCLTLLVLSSCGGSGVSSGGGDPLAITTKSLPNAQVGSAYSTTLAATGGTAPYTWSLSAGILPPGLSLDAATGMISGTPVGGPNGATLTLRVMDAATRRPERDRHPHYHRPGRGSADHESFAADRIRQYSL